MVFVKNHTPWNKGIKSWVKPWLGKKRPNLINTNAVKTMFKKGFKPWNTGKKMPQESVEKMRQAKLGYVPWNKGKSGYLSKETLERLSKMRRGVKAWNSGKTSKDDPRILAKENNPNWQGGITKINWTFRHTWGYKQWRRKILKRDDYKCILCGNTKRLHADHIIPFSINKKLRLEVSNGRTLCFWCHIKTPTWGGRSQVKEVVPYGEHV